MRQNTISGIACLSTISGISITAGAACYIIAPAVQCCSTVSAFDGVGDCVGYLHDCPDVPSGNPLINQVEEVQIGQGGKDDTTLTLYECKWQPVDCALFGCIDVGSPKKAFCFSDVPSGVNCPENQS